MKISNVKLIKNINYLKTAVRFKNDIVLYSHLKESIFDKSAFEMDAIKKSIPDKYIASFDKLVLKPEILDSPTITKLHELRTQARKIYDIVIDKPIAKTKSAVYFSKENIKGLIKTLLKKEDNKIGLKELKNILPEYYRIPETVTNENAQNFLIEFMRDYGFTKSEIKNLSTKKQPRFYRFIGEEELRSLKMGNKIKSSAWYNIDFNRTDITSNPNYYHHGYRITFKNNPQWNPAIENSRVTSNDFELRKWHLTGPYTKEDIVCAERV